MSDETGFNEAKIEGDVSQFGVSTRKYTITVRKIGGDPTERAIEITKNIEKKLREM